MVSSHRLGLGMPVVAFLSLIAPAVMSSTPDTHSAATTVGHTAAVAAADPTPTARPQFGQLPIAFERNQGQTDAAVAFFSRGPGYSLFLMPTEAVFSLRPAPKAHEAHPTPTKTPAAQAPTAVVRMALSGAKRDAQIEGLEPQASKSHYFRGNDPAQWQSDVAHYGKVRYRAVYDGIDVIYYGNQQQLEYDFVVAPGANPAQIGLQFDGPQAMRLDDSGNLVLATTQGDLLQHKPIAYQDIAGQRKPVDARYRLLADHRVAFAVGDYDRKQPLVIDPVLSYSTYLGGSGGEAATDIAADTAGNVYVTGLTRYSTDFPLAARAPADSKWDIFVSKFNAAGSLVYSAYLGGSDDDNAQDLAIDSLGAVYVTGDTRSSDFPTAAPLQATLGTNPNDSARRTDAFVFKLNAAGNALVYSTYLGGSFEDRAWGVAVDANGNAHIVGETRSYNFPIKAAVQGSLKAESDAFVSKLNATGSALVYSTFLGGSTGRPGEFGGGWEVGYAIAVDATGNAYIAGDTTSADFPTKGPMQATFGGSPDVFVTKLNAAGSAWVYSTYLGGSGHEHPEAIAVDSAGNAYVVGQTYHDLINDFPTMAPLQGTWGGGYSDAFISKFNAAGNALLYSTYLGGSGYDYANDVAIDMAGNVHVTGGTDSSNFPMVAAWQPGFSGSDETFVSKLNASGSALVYSSFLGGTGADIGHGIALDGAGNVYVAGGTNSFDFPITKPLQARPKGPDAFVTKIDGTLTAVRRTRNDFNDDGKADIAWRSTATGANTLWLSANINTYMQQPWLDLPWKAVGLADFNGDNKTDILWRDASAGTNTIWRSGVLEQAVTSLASPWFVAGVGDFNGDGRADIFWRNGSTGANGIWRSADSRFTTNPGAAPTAWVVVGVGDFDGDRKADILWRNSSTGANSLWKSGNATTGVSLVSVPNLAWKVAGVGDFDGDGKDDILWRNYSTGANSLWKSGNAAAGVSLGGVSNFAWKIASVGDYDGDRRSDILWRNGSTGANVIWKSANYSTPQTVTGVTSQAWIIVP